jgi:hypothetical protein
MIGYSRPLNIQRKENKKYKISNHGNHGNHKKCQIWKFGALFSVFRIPTHQ